MFSINWDEIKSSGTGLIETVLTHPANPAHNIHKESKNFDEGMKTMGHGITTGDSGMWGAGLAQTVNATGSIVASAGAIAVGGALGSIVPIAGVAAALLIEEGNQTIKAQLDEGSVEGGINKRKEVYGQYNESLASAGTAFADEIIKEDPFGKMVADLNDVIDKLSGQAKVDEKKKNLMLSNLAFNKEATEKEIKSLIDKEGRSILEKRLQSMQSLDRSIQGFSESGVSTTSGSLAGRIQNNLSVIQNNADIQRLDALNIASSMRAQTLQTEKETLTQYEIDKDQRLVDQKIETAKTIINLGAGAGELISKIATMGVI